MYYKSLGYHQSNITFSSSETHVSTEWHRQGISTPLLAAWLDKGSLCQDGTATHWLLVAYLYCIGRQDSATCPHCNVAEEMAEHPVLHYPAHDRLGGSHGPTSTIRDTCGASWRGWGGDQSPRLGIQEREWQLLHQTLNLRCYGCDVGLVQITQLLLHQTQRII